jgi:four helix bundle protein
MFDFQKLEVYRKAKQFHLDCQSLIVHGSFQKHMNDQLSRAASSIAINIAEGSARFTPADRANFFKISRGSVFECVSILDILKDQELVTQESYGNMLMKADELSRILYRMISNLNEKKLNR